MPGLVQHLWVDELFCCLSSGIQAGAFRACSCWRRGGADAMRRINWRTTTRVPSAGSGACISGSSSFWDCRVGGCSTMASEFVIQESKRALADLSPASGTSSQLDPFSGSSASSRCRYQRPTSSSSSPTPSASAYVPSPPPPATLTNPRRTARPRPRLRPHPLLRRLLLLPQALHDERMRSLGRCVRSSDLPHHA